MLVRAQQSEDRCPHNNYHRRGTVRERAHGSVLGVVVAGAGAAAVVDWILDSDSAKRVKGVQQWQESHL